MASQESIYIVFRGSSSIDDWINNLDSQLTTYPSCNDCEVHKGFYEAEQSVSAYIQENLLALLSDYPSYSVIVTGHSLGGAMATLTALDLTNILTNNPLRLFNFDSPRVGNMNFAAHTSDVLKDRNRVTHKRDIVPHLPWHRRFVHISGEWYEDENGIHQCTGYEDPNCAYQWYWLSVDDHLVYLNLQIDCDTVG